MKADDGLHIIAFVFPLTYIISLVLTIVFDIISRSTSHTSCNPTKAVFDAYIEFIKEGNYIGGRGDGTGYVSEHHPLTC